MSRPLVWRFSGMVFIVLLTLPFSLLADSSVIGLNRCAHELGHITVGKDHIGEVFVEEDIVFTTIHWDLRGSKDKELFLLMVMNDSGLYAFALPAKGMHRVQFRVPDVDPRLPAKTYYLNYHHSSTMPDRYTEFSVNQPAAGVSWSKYYSMRKVSLTKLQMKQVWLFHLKKKAQSISSAMALGQMERESLMNGNLSLCKNLLPGQVKLTRKMNHTLETLELLGPNQIDVKHRMGRMPASL